MVGKCVSARHLRNFAPVLLEARMKTAGELFEILFSSMKRAFNNAPSEKQLHHQTARVRVIKVAYLYTEAFAVVDLSRMQSKPFNFAAERHFAFIPISLFHFCERRHSHRLGKWSAGILKRPKQNETPTD